MNPFRICSECIRLSSDNDRAGYSRSLRIVKKNATLKVLYLITVWSQTGGNIGNVRTLHNALTFHFNRSTKLSTGPDKTCYLQCCKKWCISIITLCLWSINHFMSVILKWNDFALYEICMQIYFTIVWFCEIWSLYLIIQKMQWDIQYNNSHLQKSGDKFILAFLLFLCY